MKASIKNNILTIEIPVANDPAPSKTGKSRILASTGGNQPVALTVNGQQTVVKIGVNAFIPLTPQAH